MSTLSVGDLQGLAVNSNVVTVPTGHSLVVTDAGGLTAPGHILQIVRATDTTQRTTTSTSFVDANISVTITPTSATSDIMVIWISSSQPTGGSSFTYQENIITDSSNVVISGAEEMEIGASGTVDTYQNVVLVGFDSPATTSATTYKGRFLAGTGVTARLRNEKSTGQLFAIEVGA